MSDSSIVSRSPSLVDSVAERIRTQITSCVYAVGDRLPTERELTIAFGVSRPIVREAIGILKRDGLIKTRQGLGAFVVETRETAFRINPIQFGEPTDLRNIIELLTAIESAATALAAQRHSEEELAEIHRCMVNMESAIERGEPGVEEDITFHQAIVKASGNPYFMEMSNFLDDRVRNFIRQARTSTTQKRLIASVFKEHQQIYDAICARDEPRARYAAAAHLLGAAERLAIYSPNQGRLQKGVY